MPPRTTSSLRRARGCSPRTRLPETRCRCGPGGSRLRTSPPAFCSRPACSRRSFGRGRAGLGERIEISLLAAALAAQIQDLVWLPGELGQEGPVATSADLADRAEEIAGGLATNPYYRCYETRDGFLAVACLNLVQRQAFADLFGLDDPTIDAPDVMPGDPALVERKRAVTTTVVEAMLREDLAVWRERLAAIGVPSGPVQARERVHRDPQIGENGFLAEIEQPELGPVVMLGRLFGIQSGGAPLGPAPALGADTESVLAEVGAR